MAKKKEEILEEVKNLITREDGTCKKVLLYAVSTAALLKDGAKLLEKLQRNMKVYEENGDRIFVIFTVQFGAREKLQILRPDIVAFFDTVIEQYTQAAICKTIDYEDMDYIYDICDAYYGDWGIGAWRCRLMKKPVMIQDAHVE
ncbi:MAG: hypothetical protein E7302_04240 [Butyrivibrio sp.]|nr:hypothetical protein [Butyrivibrio sp.]